MGRQGLSCTIGASHEAGIVRDNSLIFHGDPDGYPWHMPCSLRNRARSEHNTIVIEHGKVGSPWNYLGS